MWPRLRLEIREIILTLFMSSVLFLSLHIFVAEARVIISGSMLPTIKIGDRVIVEKISPHCRLLNRQDVIIFTPPPTAQTTEDYIKRVIGLPKDVIEIKQGQVLVNNQPLKEHYLQGCTPDDFGPVTVPENCLFVMGDNRVNSFDSRSWGMLPLANVKGKAWLRYYPFPRFGFLP